MGKQDRSSFYHGSIDSHAHLQSLDAKGLDPDTILTECVRNGFSGILDVGVVPSDLLERLDRFRKHDIVMFAAGFHPTEIRPQTAETLFSELREAVTNIISDAPDIAPRLVAVGEIGLDYYWDSSHSELQKQILVQLFHFAGTLDLPVIIHNRNSEEDMIHLLREHTPPGVMHCFSQGPDYCKRCLDLGMYVSFGGNLTYKRSDAIRAAASIVPADRILVETDSPYLSPQSVRGITNHPGHLGFTLEALATIRGVSTERLAEMTAQNARDLFRQ